MRTTQATRAVERLRARAGNPQYSAVGMPGGLFYLVDRSSGAAEKLCAPMPLEDFVAFVDGLGPKSRARSASSTSRSSSRSRTASARRFGSQAF